MAGIVEIDKLLESMCPEIQQGEFVFCTVCGDISNYLHLKPIGTFVEREGLTLIVSREAATSAGLSFEGAFKQLTLCVHSSLDAVGLTAAVATQLASRGLSANVVAAYFHDHIFVQSEKADDALSALREFGSSSR